MTIKNIQDKTSTNWIDNFPSKIEDVGKSVGSWVDRNIAWLIPTIIIITLLVIALIISLCILGYKYRIKFKERKEKEKDFNNLLSQYHENFMSHNKSLIEQSTLAKESRIGTILKISLHIENTKTRDAMVLLRDSVANNEFCIDQNAVYQVPTSKNTFSILAEHLMPEDRNHNFTTSVEENFSDHHNSLLQRLSFLPDNEQNKTIKDRSKDLLEKINKLREYKNNQGSDVTEAKNKITEIIGMINEILALPGIGEVITRDIINSSVNIENGTAKISLGPVVQNENEDQVINYEDCDEIQIFNYYLQTTQEQIRAWIKEVYNCYLEDRNFNIAVFLEGNTRKRKINNGYNRRLKRREEEEKNFYIAHMLEGLGSQYNSLNYLKSNQETSIAQIIKEETTENPTINNTVHSTTPKLVIPTTISKTEIENISKEVLNDLLDKIEKEVGSESTFAITQKFPPIEPPITNNKSNNDATVQKKEPEQSQKKREKDNHYRSNQEEKLHEVEKNLGQLSNSNINFNSEPLTTSPNTINKEVKISDQYLKILDETTNADLQNQEVQSMISALNRIMTTLFQVKKDVTLINFLRRNEIFQPTKRYIGGGLAAALTVPIDDDFITANDPKNSLKLLAKLLDYKKISVPNTIDTTDNQEIDKTNMSIIEDGEDEIEKIQSALKKICGTIKSLKIERENQLQKLNKEKSDHINEISKSLLDTLIFLNYQKTKEFLENIKHSNYDDIYIKTDGRDYLSSSLGITLSTGVSQHKLFNQGNRKELENFQTVNNLQELLDGLKNLSERIEHKTAINNIGSKLASAGNTLNSWANSAKNFVQRKKLAEVSQGEDQKPRNYIEGKYFEYKAKTTKESKEDEQIYNNLQRLIEDQEQVHTSQTEEANDQANSSKLINFKNLINSIQDLQKIIQAIEDISNPRAKLFGIIPSPFIMGGIGNCTGNIQES